ncbi:MAG: trigger factor [Bacteroidia bacterium]
MEIKKENIDDLHAVLKVKIEPVDHQQKVETVIKEHQRKATIPGFRPGKVPGGMIRKMYGKSILAEEINKILADSIDSYINENKIEILGNPLPKPDDEPVNNWENPADFEFHYDIGLAPQYDLNLSPSQSFDYYKMKVDDDLFNKYLDDIRRRYGKFSRPEVVEAGNILYGKFDELDEEGNVKNEGITTTTTISLDLIRDEELKQHILGLKKDEEIKINFKKAFEEPAEISSLLSISREEAESLNSDFKFNILSINKIEKAEINQELFDKIYEPGTVTSEDDFNEKIKAEIWKIFEVDADRKLKDAITDYLLQHINPQLPDDFLKRWLMAVNENPISHEQLDKEYNNYSKYIKLQLIESKIAKENNIEVHNEEIEAYARQLIRNQFAQYGQMDPEQEKINELANSYLQKSDRIRQIYETLLERKAFEYLKSFFTLNIIELPHDEFLKAVKPPHNHDHEHQDHDHEHHEHEHHHEH